ncbi:MAG: DUF5110 domain-containing protein [Mycoplasmoidaceae bacterium]|nr:DUF5110 domain-containing protein [Mycoplasmoidaceae bacterium]
MSDKFESYLYEDDFETVAYQDGNYRKSPYSCYYDGSNFVITLNKPTGSYIGDEKIKNRLIKLRLHKSSGINFGEITVDGKGAQTTAITADPSVEMPFNFEGSSKTNDIVEIFIMEPSVEHEIKIQII